MFETHAIQVPLRANRSALLQRLIRIRTADGLRDWKLTNARTQFRLYESGSEIDFRAGGILDIGNMRLAAGTRNSSFEVTLAIGSTHGPSKADVDAGVLVDAQVDAYLVDILNPLVPPYHRTRWWVGDWVVEGSRLVLDLRGIESRLKKSYGFPIQPKCKHKFGDAGCDFGGTISPNPNWAFRHYKVRAGSTVGKLVISAHSDGFPTDSRTEADWWANGVVRFTSGAHTGRELSIRSNTQPVLGGDSLYRATFTLTTPLLVPPVEGDIVEVRVGCNHLRTGDCLSKFNNTDNFQGYDAVPGTDTIVGTPAGG